MAGWLDKFTEKPLGKEAPLANKQPKGGVALVRGNVVQLHHMRQSCQAADHCLSLTTQGDCNLFPVQLGWCRERI